MSRPSHSPYQRLSIAGADRIAFLISGVPRPESIQLLIDRERDRERSAHHGTSP